MDPRIEIMKLGIVRICRFQGLELNMPEKGFQYSALRAWDDIPANVREIQTLGRFKKRTKSALEEVRMLIKNTLKHDPLEEHPIFSSITCICLIIETLYKVYN